MKFFKRAPCDHGLPVHLVIDALDLRADGRVLAHDAQFPSLSRVTIDTRIAVGVGDRDHVELPVCTTSEVPDALLVEQMLDLRVRQITVQRSHSFPLKPG